MKKKAIIAGVVLAFMMSACGYDGGSEGGYDNPPSNETAQESTNGRDGQFEFTIQSMECGLEVVTDEYDINHQPTDQFCEVSIRVDNIGDEAQDIDTSSYYAIGEDGTKYDSADEFWLYEQLNPGQGKEVTVVYDLPEGVEPTTLELHDSFLSDGVEVTVP